MASAKPFVFMNEASKVLEYDDSNRKFELDPASPRPVR